MEQVTWSDLLPSVPSNFGLNRFGPVTMPLTVICQIYFMPHVNIWGSVVHMLRCTTC